MISRFTVPDLEPWLPDMEPVRKYVVLVLWQAQQDRADEVLIGQAIPNQGVPIRYLVAGSWYDIEPFPEHLRGQVVQTAIEMSERASSIPYPWQGAIDLHVSEDIQLCWSVQLPAPDADLLFRPL